MGREIAYLAVFVALVICAQVALSFVPSVELSTLLFVSYAFAAGARRGCFAATMFAFLRQFVFGFFPTVLLLYLAYFNLLALTFAFCGHRVKNPLKELWWLTLLACVCTACFSGLDCVINALWYGLSKSAVKAYFVASLPFMFPQIACVAITVGLLFLPAQRIFAFLYKTERKKM